MSRARRCIRVDVVFRRGRGSFGSVVWSYYVRLTFAGRASYSYRSGINVDSLNRLYTTFVPVEGLFGFENPKKRLRRMIRNPEAFLRLFSGSSPLRTERPRCQTRLGSARGLLLRLRRVGASVLRPCVLLVDPPAAASWRLATLLVSSRGGVLLGPTNPEAVSPTRCSGSP